MDAATVREATVPRTSRWRAAALSLLVMADAALGLDVAQWWTGRTSARTRVRLSATSRRVAPV